MHHVFFSPVLSKHALCYPDGIVIYSRGFRHHLQDLEEMLQLLLADGLKLNMEKCYFAATTIDFV